MPVPLVSPRILDTQEERKRSSRPWPDKFFVAFRGIKFGIRGQSSFAVHFFCAIGVVLAAVVFGCDRVEWCMLIGCIGLVLTAELFNSSIETLFRGLDESARERVWPCLDIASAGVLIASLTAAAAGLIVFLPKFIAWIKGFN